MVIQQFTITQRGIRRLKPSIDKLYPAGHYVATEGDEVIADAPTFQEVDGILNTAGKTSKDLVVVQAGVDYPDYGFILH